jgi:hypothetical protein
MFLWLPIQEDLVMRNFVIITGDVVNGLIHTGPFKSSDKAHDYADKWFDDFYVIELYAPIKETQTPSLDNGSTDTRKKKNETDPSIRT